jgi:polyisoprenoid-binding protein YceI
MLKHKIYIWTFLSLIFLNHEIFAGKTSDTYNLEIGKSSLEWEGKKLVGTHNGTVKLISGFLKVSDNEIKGGEFKVDMTTITDKDLDDKEYNAKLVNHLKSEDFFNVLKYPKAVFKITKAEKYKDPANTNYNYKIFGNMTIKNITNPISFFANIGLKGNAVSARTKLTLDRTKWGIKYKSKNFFENLGDKFIYDDFVLWLELTFSK